MFKNITILNITAGFPKSVDVLETALQAMPFVATTGSEQKTYGWVPPRGEAHGALAESVNGRWILRFMVEARQVPAAVAQRRVDEMAANIEATTGRKPGKKERRDLKEDAMAALLPQAFARQHATWVWVDQECNRLVIDTTSAAVSDDITTALVKLLDGFVVEPLKSFFSPSSMMSGWLAEQVAPDNFKIGKECELKAADESQACVRYTHHQLVTEEVQAHIVTGKQPTRLALDWDGRVSFVLTDTLHLKKVTFADDVLEQAKARSPSSDDFDGNVLMATAELGPLIADLVDALGGEEGMAA
jgi:recombination associated protein RdgC